MGECHAIFEGLPSGGLMDYAYYREVIPDSVEWARPAGRSSGRGDQGVAGLHLRPDGGGLHTG